MDFLLITRLSSYSESPRKDPWDFNRRSPKLSTANEGADAGDAEAHGWGVTGTGTFGHFRLNGYAKDWENRCFLKFANQT